MVPGCEGSFKSHKNAFLNDPKGRFTWFTANILFGLLNRLHIAYFDSSKWSLPFGNGIAHVWHLDHSIVTLR